MAVNAKPSLRLVGYSKAILSDDCRGTLLVSIWPLLLHVLKVNAQKSQVVHPMPSAWQPTHCWFARRSAASRFGRCELLVRVKKQSSAPSPSHLLKGPRNKWLTFWGQNKTWAKSGKPTGQIRSIRFGQVGLVSSKISGPVQGNELTILQAAASPNAVTHFGGACFRGGLKRNAQKEN